MQQACDSAHTAREAMETLHGNLMETEAAMETQAAPAFFLAALDGDAETVRETVQLRIVQVVKIMRHLCNAPANGAHLAREGAPDGNGGCHGNGGSSRILSGCA